MDQQTGAIAETGTAQPNPASAPSNHGNATTANSGVITLTAADFEARLNAKAAETRRSIEQQQETDRQTAETKRKQDEAVAKGEFDKVKDQLTTERDNANKERETMAATLRSVIDAKLKPLSDADKSRIRKLVPENMPLSDQLGAIDAALELLNAGAQQSQRGNTGDPKRQGGNQERDIVQERANAHWTGVPQLNK